MWRAATLLGLVLAGAAPLSAQTGPAQSEFQTVDAQLVRRYRDAEVAYGRGRELFETKDFGGARRELGACLELVPAHADAHLLMAKVLYVEKDYAQALAEVERAEAGRETTATIVARMQADRMSELRARLREKEDAIAARRNPTVPRRAISQDEVDRDEINRILNAERPNPVAIPAEYSFFHGNVLLRLNRPGEAAAQYEEALNADPAYAEAANNLAALYHSARQDGKAREVVTKAESNGAVVNAELKTAIDVALGSPR